VRRGREGGRKMPPLKKSKKGKRKSKDPHSSKLKVARTRSAPPPLPPELRGLDTEWWYTFLHKHAESGIHAPPDSPLPLSRTGAVTENSRPWLLHSPKSALAAAPHGLHGGRRGHLLIRACRFPRWPGVGPIASGPSVWGPVDSAGGFYSILSGF